MTEDLSQKTVGVDDEEALHRAVIEELYEKKKQKKERDSTVEKDVYDYKSSVLKYFSILHNPRKFGSKVTGIETSPTLPNSIEDVSDLNNSDIECIRFEIGSYKTKWYDWVGEDLENIVDYYADGDISEFISDTKMNLDVKSDGNQAQVNIPDNLNSRKDRIKEKLESRKRVLSQEGFNVINSRPEVEKRAYAIFYTFLVVWIILNLAINRGGAFFASMTLILFLFVYLMIGSLWQVKSDNKYGTYDPIQHLKPMYEPINKTLKILYERIDKID